MCDRPWCTCDDYDAVEAENAELRVEVMWRKRAMGDAKDALACGDGRAAWDALNRHEKAPASFASSRTEGPDA